MAKNKIITSQGNVQFINSKGKTINMHPMHCYAVYENDTVSFLFIYMKEYSGQAFFSSQFEDLEVNGESYGSLDELKEAINYAFAKAGAQARTEIVDELPETGYTNTIYLVKKEHGEGYDEYIYNEEKGWQLLGDTDIEFERYLKIDDFNPYSADTKDYIDAVSGNTVQNASDIVFLSGAVDTEIAARETADSFISGAVDTVSANLASEVSRAISAETTLQNNINAANARIDAEQTARALADTALSGAVDTEVSNRISADTALQTAIDNEASARTDADSALSDKIDYVSGAVDTVSSDLSSEVSRAQGAESALNTKVNALSGAIDSVDDKVDALSGEVQTMGDEAIVDAEYVSSSTTIDFYNASGNVVAQVDATDFIKDGMIEDVRIENGYLVIDFNTESGIQDIEIPLTDIFNPDNYYDKTAIDGIVSGINEDIADEVSARTDADTALQSAIDTVSGNVETETSRAESAETALQTAIDNEVSARTAAITAAVSGKADSSDVYTKSEVYTKAEVDSAITAVEGEISGISDSLSAYSTTVEMNAAIDAATSGLATPYSAGTAIDITSNVISFTLPISAGTGNRSIVQGQGTKATAPNSHAEGYFTEVTGSYSHAEGSSTKVTGSYSHAEGATTSATSEASHAEGIETLAKGKYSHAEGVKTIANNNGEHASGRYNISSSASTIVGDSGNTTFSIGNGNNNTRHNAFEVRENGDIYIADTNATGEFYEKPMIKLQDALGSSIEVSSAITSGDTNPVQGGVLYNELRLNVTEQTETLLQWEQSDGGESTNYPSGCTKITVEVDENEMTFGGYTLYNDNYDCFGLFNIESNGGVITVSTTDCVSEPTTSITYSISGNVVTIEYPTITNVTIIGTSYDNYWAIKAISGTSTVTPLIDQVTANTATLASLEENVNENEEVTSAGLNALNDKFGGLKLMKITQAAYDALTVKDNNTLYIISD